MIFPRERLKKEVVESGRPLRIRAFPSWKFRLWVLISLTLCDFSNDILSGKKINLTMFSSISAVTRKLDF